MGDWVPGQFELVRTPSIEAVDGRAGRRERIRGGKLVARSCFREQLGDAAGDVPSLSLTRTGKEERKSATRQNGRQEVLQVGMRPFVPRRNRPRTESIPKPLP